MDLYIILWNSVFLKNSLLKVSRLHHRSPEYKIKSIREFYKPNKKHGLKLCLGTKVLCLYWCCRGTLFHQNSNSTMIFTNHHQLLAKLPTVMK